MDFKAMLASWQPTAMAAISAFFGFVLFSPELFEGAPWLMAIAKYGLAGGMVGFGLVVKQHNISGGTVSIPSSAEVKAAVTTTPTATTQKTGNQEK